MAMRFETVKSSVTLSVENQRIEIRGIIWMAFILSGSIYIRLSQQNFDPIFTTESKRLRKGQNHWYSGLQN